MDKLSTFQSNDSAKLFKLAKSLHLSKKFFEIFLNDFQFKILTFIIEQNNVNLWNAFIQGNCTLNITKDSDTPEDDSAANLDDGDKPIKLLALHIRYLLWEKAIDFYYSSQKLDESSNTIDEVTDDYELINQLDDGDDETAEKTTQIESAPEPKVREEEEDNYDDDDDEEEPKQEAKPEPIQAGDLKLNDDNKVIIEIPMSVFSKPDEEAIPSQSTSGTPAPSALANDSAINDNPVTTEVLEDQELLIKEFNKVYHNFEYDKETLIKRRKLEKSDMQLENNNDSKDTNGNLINDDDSNSSNNIGINLGSNSLSLRHLLNKIQQNRDDININDYELRTLFNDVRKNRGKWSNDERVGQEELYESCEKVALDLRGYTEHSTPFLNKVSKREAPNYGLIIKKPMDLNTVLKKLKNLSYNSKKEFVDDLMLIWSNCLTYNADPKHFIRAHALAMQKKTLKLIPTIPDITIRNRADVEKEEAELENNEISKSPLGGGKATKKGRKRTREEKIKTEDITIDSPDITPSSLMGTPKPDGTPGVEPASAIDEGGTGAVDEEDEDFDGEEIRNEDDEGNDEEEVDPELQAWRSLTAKSRATYCATRSDLFDENSHLKYTAPAIIRKPNEMANFNHYLDNKQVVSKSSNLLENDEPYLLEYDITGGLPGIIYKGNDEEDEEKREQKLADIFLQQSGGDPNKIRSPFVMSVEEGLNSIYVKNITEIQEIRKICFKISLIRQMQTQQFVHHTQMKQPEIETIKEIDVDPISKLSNHDLFYDRTQYYVLRRNIAKIAMQTGYETAEPFAINTLAQVAETYLGNLIKSIKLHTESNSSNKLKDREVLLLSLLENGVDKPDDLYTFVQERIIKQLDKLKDLRDKLSNFLKELLRPGLENFNERSFDDNSEQFMTGDFSSDLGDDFFGFKELGLDKEFKMLSSSIPIYLLHSRLHNSYSSSGVANKRNKYEDFKEWEVQKLYEADIDDQIGLLQPFYAKLLEKSKTHYVKGQRKKGESTELPSPDHLILIEDDELPQKQRNIRPRLPPTGKISSIKKRIVANAFFLPDSDTSALPEEPTIKEVAEIKKESSSKPASPKKPLVKA